VQRRVRDLDALPQQQPANLRQPDVACEQLLDRLALLLVCSPAVAVRSCWRRVQQRDDLRDELVGQRRDAIVKP
jgi:hypothetical protein